MPDGENKDGETSQGESEGESSGDRFNRRGFFSEGLRSLFKPLAKAVEQRVDRVGLPDWSSEKRLHDGYRSPARGSDRGRSTGMPDGSPLPDRELLRPPGAIEEDIFLDTCMASGECVRACPVDAIQWASETGDPREEGKPFIDPQQQACVVCEELACMQVCPSGALTPIAKEDIRMGIAVVREEVCVRQTGEDCQICVDKCPIGERAIEIPYFGSPVEVHENGCTGCGVCEMYCPTEPRAIVIEPLSRGGRLGAHGSDTGAHGSDSTEAHGSETGAHGSDKGPASDEESTKRDPSATDADSPPSEGYFPLGETSTD